jgi:hypothetical protein
MEKSGMDNRERQYRDSAQLTAWGMMGIIAVVIVMVMTGGSDKNTGEVGLAEMADTNHTLEADSIDQYMRDWYERLDTNSNGDIDDTESDEYRMWITGDGDTIWE